MSKISDSSEVNSFFSADPCFCVEVNSPTSDPCFCIDVNSFNSDPCFCVEVNSDEDRPLSADPRLCIEVNSPTTDPSLCKEVNSPTADPGFCVEVNPTITAEVDPVYQGELATLRCCDPTFPVLNWNRPSPVTHAYLSWWINSSPRADPCPSVLWIRQLYPNYQSTPLQWPLPLYQGENTTRRQPLPLYRGETALFCDTCLCIEVNHHLFCYPCLCLEINQHLSCDICLSKWAIIKQKVC